MFRPGDFPALTSSLPVTEIAPPVHGRPGELHRERLTAPLGVVLRLPPPRHVASQEPAAEQPQEARARRPRS